MKTYAEMERSAQLALLRLSKRMNDPDVLLIPISIVDHKVCGFPIAATDLNGIMLTDLAVTKDPFHLEVFISHEIFHDVVHDPMLNHVFVADVLNCAEDYKINQHLDELYKYQVEKTKFPGLRNKKFDSLSIKQIARRLKGKSEAHFVNSVKHPAIIQVAKKLRDKLGYRTERPCVKLTNGYEYFSILRKHYPKFVFPNLPNVDPELVVKCLWMRFYEFPIEWDHSAFGKVLTHSQALSVVPNIVSPVLHDPEFSIFSALFILKVFDNSDKLVMSMVNKLKKRIDRLDMVRKIELRARLEYSKKHTLAARRQIRLIDAKLLKMERYRKQLKLRIKGTIGLPKLSSLLNERASIAVRSAPQKAVSLSSSIVIATDAPKYDRSHALVKMLNFLMKATIKDLLDLLDSYQKISEFADPFTSEQEQDEGEVFDSGEDDMPPSSDGGDEEEGDESSTGEGSEGEEPADGDQEGGEESGDGQNSEPASSQNPSPKPSNSKSSGGKEKPSSGRGRGRGGNSKIQALETLQMDPRIFKMIIHHAMEFGDKLVSNPSYSLSDNSIVDRTLTYGRDLSRLPSSELGRLGSETAKLSFLVDLANNNLLQYSDLDPRRAPLILMLDCSGSMQGKTYAIAAGFCLSMIRKLTHARRSCALIKFSGGVDQVLVFDKGANVTFVQLLKALLTPSYGGTDFDVVFSKAYDIHEQFRWTQCQGLLITDGQATISDATVARKPKGFRSTGVIIGHATNSKLDECYQVKRSGLSVELLKAGNRLL